MNAIFVSERKLYLDLDQIRVIVEDGKIVGWYRPGMEDEDNAEAD